MGQAAQAFANFWKQPFNSQGSAGNWFLFIGLLLVIIFAWTRILKFITE
jgi:hypothetical protein